MAAFAHRASARPGEEQFWMGDILMPNAACPRLAFIVSFKRPDPASPWSGALSITRGCGVAGAIDIALKDVTLSDERVAFTSADPASENVYEASRTPNDPVATGMVRIGGLQSIPIRMWQVSKEQATIAAPQRPQVPVGELPYDLLEVVVPVPLGGQTAALSGVLSIPRGPGPHPAVVMVSDAEAQDCDHTEGTHRPFFILADRLTRAGYAVLRCDDRGINASAGSYNDMTLEEAASDVAAQIAFLRGIERIDASRIGVLGRGQGALVGAMAAGRDDSTIAFLVLANAPGQKGLEAACSRESRMLSALGEDPEYTKARVGRLRAILELVLSPDGATLLHNALTADIRAYTAALRGMGTELTNDQVTMWAASRAEMMNRAVFRSWLTAEPAAAYRRVRCPVLVLSAGLDMVMPQQDQLPLIRAALAESKSPRTVIKELPRMNHWMQPSVSGFDDELDLIATTVDEEAIADILAFVASITRP